MGHTEEDGSYEFIFNLEGSNFLLGLFYSSTQMFIYNIHR